MTESAATVRHPMMSSCGDLSAVGALPFNVVLVGTYPPTECGIATHTANLRCALEDAGIDAAVIRLLGPEDDAGPARQEVAAIWRRGEPAGLDDPIRAADSVDAVIVQHEYGIYPGPNGADIVDFVTACTRPVLTVLHTIVPDPTDRQRAIIAALAARSRLLIVHTQAARRRLLDTHDLDPARVVVIPHGASPNLRGAHLVTSEEPLALTWGLLGPGKGFEHGIEAVALMRDRGLDVRYLIAGQTHPTVRARQGEQYRHGLRELAVRRGVADLVDFDDRYRDWDSLHALVRSATVVVIPYDSRDQVTSGVLVEALAAGKPVVSTAFPHATELEPTGAVVAVDHESPGQIADAVSRIVLDPVVHEQMSAAARLEGKHYDWSSIGARYDSHLRSVLGDGDSAPLGAGATCS